MKKKTFEDFDTKAKKREIKNRPRMKMHGANLKQKQIHGGKKLTAKN